MRIVYVSIPTVMDVKRFVESISSLEGDFDLIDGRYVVDARSLMGIFGMDLSKPIKLCIHKDSKKALRAVEGFVVEAPVDAPADTPVGNVPAMEETGIEEPVNITKGPQSRLVLEEI